MILNYVFKKLFFLIIFAYLKINFDNQALLFFYFLFSFYSFRILINSFWVSLIFSSSFFYTYLTSFLVTYFFYINTIYWGN